MKTVITRLSMALAIGLLATSTFAQTTVAPSPADALAVVAPPVDTTDFPARLVIVGAGIHNGQPSVFTNLLIHAAGPVYAALAEDVVAGKTSTRAGIETIVFRQSGLYFSVKGSAGIATGVTATGGSYGVGGSVLYDLTKLKLPGYVAAFSGTWDYSNIPDFSTITAGTLKQAFSGGTYRFGIGRTF